MPWPRSQCSAALSGWVIGPPDRRCQRPSSRNRRTTEEFFALQRSPDFSGVCAVLEPQSCDVLAYYLDTESSGCQWGLPAVYPSGNKRSGVSPSPVPDSRETSRDSIPALLFAIPARLFRLLISGHPCGMPCPQNLPHEGRKTGHDKRRALSVLLIWGTWV